MRLTTGAESYEKVQESNNWDSQRRINMFKVNGLYPTFLRSGKQFTGIILPAFDSSLDELDMARPVSYEPYRSNTLQDKKTGFGAFSGWFVSIKGYCYYGVGKSTFVSPQTVNMKDPIKDLRNYIFDLDKKMGDKTYMHLVTAKDFRKEINALPKESNLALVNIWAGTTNERAKDQSVTNRVLVLREQAFTKLRHDLDTLRPVTVANPNDPDFPMFLYGDITSPKIGALQFNTMMYQSENGGFPGPALDLGKLTHQGAGVQAISATRVPVTEAMLRGRYDLGDADNVLHIPTYEEIVDLLVEEGLVPYELLQRVCSPNYNGPFPANPHGKAIAKPVERTERSVAAPADGGSAIRSKAITTEAPVAAPYEPTPTPNVPASRSASPLADEVLPGLEEVNDAPPLFQSAWTAEDEAKLAALQVKIDNNTVEMADFDIYRDLMMKKSAAGK